MSSHYQKRDVPLHEISDRIKIEDPQQVSRVILSVSPCRSGSTVLLRVFGAAGITAIFQEIKNILRWRLQDGEYQWRVPNVEEETVCFLKETLGPYTIAESTLNPLQMLLNAGMPPHKLHILILGRSPLNSWASWRSWWHHKTNSQYFILSYKTTEAVRKLAQQHNINTTTMVYESLRDNEPATVIQKLFNRLDIPFKQESVEGWHTLPAFGIPKSNIHLPAEPPAFYVAHIHDHPMCADRLIYNSRTADILQLKKEEVCTIAEAGIPALYEKWRQQSEQDLGITIAPDNSWKECQ